MELSSLGMPAGLKVGVDDSIALVALGEGADAESGRWRFLYSGLSCLAGILRLGLYCCI